MSDLITNILSTDFIARFVINIVSVIFLVWYCYFRRSPKKEYLFGFILFGIGVFVITKMLRDVQLPMGFAFGLFALFSMLRYRTESISIKEMTYLFLVIAVALITSIAPLHYLELVVINGIICLCSQIAELAEAKLCASNTIDYQMIRYDLIENIKPQRRKELLEDLYQRTGLNIVDVHVEEIDLLRDTAQLKIVYSTQNIAQDERATDIEQDSFSEKNLNQKPAFLLRD